MILTDKGLNTPFFFNFSNNLIIGVFLWIARGAQSLTEFDATKQTVKIAKIIMHILSWGKSWFFKVSPTFIGINFNWIINTSKT